jgi:predicted nucleic-acid-binding Zn-ribbon protein
MNLEYVIDRCPKCGKNYVYGEVRGIWVTWYMLIAEFPSTFPVVKIQVLHCPNCGYEFPNASADLEAKPQ